MTPNLTSSVPISALSADSKINDILLNSKQSKYSFYATHSQDVSSDALIQCTCNSLISVPTVCRVSPQYQPLLNTSVFRLTPGTISRASKKSRLYSQTFCFEVNLTSSLQLGDLALVLEWLDEPNNVKSQICTINNFDEFLGCKQFF